MKKFTLICFLIIFASLVACDPPKPVIPEKYYAKMVWRIPYETADTVEPITINYDKANDRARVDFYNGLEIDFYFINQAKYFYQQMIVKDHAECFIDTSEKPTTLMSYLPDLTDFEYNGEAVVKGQQVYDWFYNYTEGGKQNEYHYYVLRSDSDTPVQYALLGYNLIGHSHIDRYYVDFIDYKKNYNEQDCYVLTDPCQKADDTYDEKKQQHQQQPAHSEMDLGRMFPELKKHESRRKWSHFKTKHNKDYQDHEEEMTRFEIFHQNTLKIEKHNRENPNSFKMAHNRFSDQNMNEIYRTWTNGMAHNNIFPTYDEATSKLMKEYQRQFRDDQIPDSFNWIDYGAVSPVKDQIVCGSCWSFSTTGVIESANYLKTGSMVSFSEQNLIDCSWDYGNNGCNGGWQSWSFNYIHDFGLATTDSYGKYLGKSGYCGWNADLDSISVEKYYNITSGDDKALKEALYVNGPIAVNTDVSEKFVYYSSGVFDDKDCHSEFKDLVHCVLLVGYGIEDNKEYWLVKNSWSTHWGDEGYIKIQIKDNICGIATWTNFPILSKGQPI
ncbi:hypothetical protein M0812_27984 [Anaeramoeba flamelloides]|uniref:Uncharacterized protein n=1 Tax=Anaeramoeba flamelloides TaxID=1746091 RepID=A0AAV7YA89_9EUKA|nr:hypothetical protein M0812_27984 [Anaeramoeba flamelloides]